MLLEQEVHLQVHPTVAAHAAAAIATPTNSTIATVPTSRTASAASATNCVFRDNREQRLMGSRGVLVPRLRWPC